MNMSSAKPEPSPAEQLENLVLPGGWRVERRIEIDRDGTGQTTSCCYVGTDEAGLAVFIKAYDVRGMLLRGDMRAVEEFAKEFNHEVAVLKLCADRKLSRVTRFLDQGVVQVGREPVNFLVTEYAPGGSVREVHSPGDETKCAVKRLRMLRDVASGLAQLHSADIAHQDIKPSNAVCWQDGRIKLTDLGSASCMALASPPHDGDSLVGQPCYAPYELLYSDLRAWQARRFGCDLFLLGGLAFTTFVGVPLTDLVILSLPTQLQPKNFSGEYREVLPDLLQESPRIVRDFLIEYCPPNAVEKLIEVVLSLCHPDPAKRGYPRNIVSAAPQFSLQQYISVFDRLALTVETQRRQLEK